MKRFVKAPLIGLIMLLPPTLDAQRIGFSIGGGGSLSTGAPSAAGPTVTPPMPPLPYPSAAAPAVSLSSLKLNLKPLNLSSNNLAPQTATSPLRSKPGVLPLLPFALDSIAARGFPQMCVEPAFKGIPLR